MIALTLSNASNPSSSVCQERKYKKKNLAESKAIEFEFDLTGRIVINATTVALQVRYTEGEVANRQCQ